MQCNYSIRADFSAHSVSLGEGGGGMEDQRKDDQGLKDPCSHMLGVGGQYKMYNLHQFYQLI
jgi:hypothetical protein